MIIGKSEEFSYAAALKKARQSISLDDKDLQLVGRTKVRKAANGGLLIEITGPNGTTKAKILEEKLRVVLQEDARVVRSCSERGD